MKKHFRGLETLDQDREESRFCLEFSKNALSKYKATESRLILLYVGIVVFLGIFNFDAYLNFLLLHASIRSLTKRKIEEKDLEFAETALPEFLSDCLSIYGIKIASYNFHCVTHITEDFRRLGSVDNYSAFSYENNMTFFPNTVESLINIYSR